MRRIMFVCYGNICRSTMAESIFTYMVKERGMEKDFLIASAGTSNEEEGNPVYYATVETLQEKKIPVVPHQAVQLKVSDIKKYDFFIGMDQNNIQSMRKILGQEAKIFSLLSFVGEKGDITDPWYTRNFEKTYEDIVRGLEGFLEYLEE